MKPARVLGPYPNGPSWRLIVISDGVRKSLVLPSKEAALAMVPDLKVSLHRPVRLTVGTLLMRWIASLSARGLSPRVVRQHEEVQTRFLATVLDKSVTSLDADKARALYQAEVARILPKTGLPVAVDTQQQALRQVKALFRWAVDENLVPANPFERVRPIGMRRAGKPQLRLDEAKAWMATALAMAESGDKLALAALLLLLLGLRSSEALLRVARDVDEEGTVLWIPRGKTRNAKRRLQIPALVVPLVRALTQTTPSESLLFPATSGRPTAQPTLHRKVRQICQLAGVPVVCPHSLRGLHSTLALQAGATSEVVAGALGHASFATTARHYADPTILAQTQADKALTSLLSVHPAAPAVTGPARRSPS
ncbi:MAG TPA: tyrosine-type recombinase/integrase [Pseudomonadota bacterium]|nr:tyrosine-type recombinase/integrase [Pseudomonadota bacterium]